MGEGAAVLVLETLAAVNQALVILGVVPPRMSIPGGIALLLAFVATTPLLLPPIVQLPFDAMLSG